MKKKIIWVLFSLYFINGIGSIDINLNDENIRELLRAQKENSHAWESNEVYLKAGRLNRSVSESVLYPAVNAGIDSQGVNIIDDNPLQERSISISPELNVSQLLPTSGVLSAAASDTVTVGTKKVDDELPVDNTFNLSLSVNQPIYFKNAYEAIKGKIDKSEELNFINYIDNKNALIISAINDYYDMIKAYYRLKLVESRLETNSEYEKRIIQEHKLGMWTNSRIDQAKAARLQSEVDLLQAKSTYNAAIEKIKTLYGASLNVKEVGIEPDFIYFNKDDEEYRQLLRKNNPDNRKMEKQIVVTEADILLQEKDSAPSLSISSAYSLTEDPTKEDEFTNNLSLSLAMSFSVVDGGAAKKNVELLKNNSNRLQNDFQEQQKVIESQFRLLIDNLSVYEKLNEIYLLQDKAAAFEYEKGCRELELGGITQKDVLELQINSEDTKLTILSNKIDYNLTVLKLFRLLGIDLDLHLSSGRGE